MSALTGIKIVKNEDGTTTESVEMPLKDLGLSQDQIEKMESFAAFMRRFVAYSPKERIRFITNLQASHDLCLKEGK